MQRQWGNGTPRPAFAMELVVLLFLAVFPSGCSTFAAPKKQDHGIDLDRFEIDIGPAKRQAVLPGSFFEGGFADLAVVNSDNRGLRIYALDDGSWGLVLEETLRGEVLFVDVANLNGRDRLVTYEPGQLNWFDPESATEHALVAVSPGYRPSDEGEIPRVDIMRDVNGDGLDDLVIPGADAFEVHIQTKCGTFAEPIKFNHSLGLKWTDRSNPWLQSILQLIDYNRDGRSDLVLWNGDQFDVRIQDDLGRFDAIPKTFNLDIPYDGFAHYTLSAAQGEAGPPAGEVKKVIRACEDLNADGVVDLITVSLKGSNVFNFHSIYEVHFGTISSEGGVDFAPESDVTIHSDGLQMGLQQHDFDSDGDTDLMLITCNDLGLFKMSGGMLAGSMSLDLEFYRMEGGTYPDKSTTRRSIKGIFNEDGYYQAVLLTDVTGDGRPDLLVQKGRKELRVYPGISGPELFAKGYQKIRAVMPDNEKDTRLVDLNGDGKQDILAHRRYTDCFWRTTKPKAPHRITMLITR